MKWLRTMILFDRGDVASSPDWTALHASYVRSINAVKNPDGADRFTLRKRIPIPRKDRKEQQKYWRNGVSSIKRRFYHHLTTVEKWDKEIVSDFGTRRSELEVAMKLYPSGENYKEPLRPDFGPFDFVTEKPNGIKAVVEWETGNISSSHRSINKLCVCLNAGIIQAGVVIVPSRPLYIHLTDRMVKSGFSRSIVSCIPFSLKPVPECPK
jgi:Restriction endonuclease BamHI